MFDRPELVGRVAELALGLILFKGGYEFRHSLWGKPKVLAEGLVLALLGTLLTALITAAAARLLWLESLLLGAVLSSTDAAAVFSIFQSTGLKTSKNTTEVLELESSTNDPLAYALVVGIVFALEGPGLKLGSLSFAVAKGLLLGVAVGAVVGCLMLGLSRLVKRDRGTSEILWLAVLTSALGFAALCGANPLITAFTSGVVLSARKKVPGEFWGPLVGLSEVVLFLLLGLQVFPAVLWQNIGPALVITVILVLLSRPIAVLSLSLFFVPDWKRAVFLSWAGLRGASPIVFGLIPVIAGVPKANEIFAIVFAAVLVSVLVQGTTLIKVAEVLGVKEASS